MRKLFPVLLSLTAFACQTTMPPSDTSSTPPATTTPDVPVQAKLEVAPDTPARLVQLPRTTIDYNRSLLNENERQVVAKLIEASRYIDEIYWRQVSEDNPTLRTHLEKQAADSALDRAGYDYFVANRGRWDRLKQDDPFIAPFSPPGA